MPEAAEQDILRKFIRLEKEVRAAKNLPHFYFIICNHSKRLLNYTQAITWEKTALEGFTISAISATMAVNHKSPYVVWIEKNLCPWLITEFKDHITQIDQAAISDKIKQGWKDYLTDNVIYCPFRSHNSEEINAGVLFISTESWTSDQLTFVEELRSLYEHERRFLLGPEKKKIIHELFSKEKRKKILLSVAAVFILLFVIPVRQTILAPADVAPKDPFLVSSSIEGIIKAISVNPNQNVKANQILFSLDKITLQNKYEESEKTVEIAKERYRKAFQQAYVNPEGKSELLVLKEEVDKANNDYDYAKLLLERSDIRAKFNGIVIFSSAKDWLGKPIKIGEKVMLLAGSDNKQLDILIPQSDMIEIHQGDKVKFFPDVNPLHAIAARVDYASFVATVTPSGKLNYYVAANFNEKNNIPRYGAHGTAKVYGHYVSLFFYLFKRPLIYIQSKLGI